MLVFVLKSLRMALTEGKLFLPNKIVQYFDLRFNGINLEALLILFKEDQKNE